MNDLLLESAKEIEALREKVAEWERGDRQYPQAVQDYKALCVELKRTQFDLAAMTQQRDTAVAYNSNLQTCIDGYRDELNPELEHSATHTGYYTTDQLRQAKVEVLREIENHFESLMVYSSAADVRRMADEIERSKT